MLCRLLLSLPLRGGRGNHVPSPRHCDTKMGPEVLRPFPASSDS